MKRHSPAEAGIGFTIFVAAATFVIAVVAGIFLIYQSETTLGSNTQLRALAQAQMTLAESPDVQRGLPATLPSTSNEGIAPPISTPP